MIAGILQSALVAESCVIAHVGLIMAVPAPSEMRVRARSRVQLRWTLKIILFLARFIVLPVVSLVGILAFVDTFAAEDKRCFVTGILVTQWPSSIACAIAKHESLATG